MKTKSYLNRIVEMCKALELDNDLTIKWFGKNGDLELYIHKNYDSDTLVSISTSQNGKFVDDVNDISMDKLYLQLIRIYNYVNFRTMDE
jgi:hypothetical protein|nr:MAG TPA: hypothetical protein [Caudoviricetes sp.]